MKEINGNYFNWKLEIKMNTKCERSPTERSNIFLFDLAVVSRFIFSPVNNQREREGVK